MRKARDLAGLVLQEQRGRVFDTKATTSPSRTRQGVGNGVWRCKKRRDVDSESDEEEETLAQRVMGGDPPRVLVEGADDLGPTPPSSPDYGELYEASELPMFNDDKVVVPGSAADKPPGTDTQKATRQSQRGESPGLTHEANNAQAKPSPRGRTRSTNRTHTLPDDMAPTQPDTPETQQYGVGVHGAGHGAQSGYVNDVPVGQNGERDGESVTPGKRRRRAAVEDQYVNDADDMDDEGNDADKRTKRTQRQQDEQGEDQQDDDDGEERTRTTLSEDHGSHFESALAVHSQESVFFCCTPEPVGEWTTSQWIRGEQHSTSSSRVSGKGWQRQTLADVVEKHDNNLNKAFDSRTLVDTDDDEEDDEDEGEDEGAKDEEDDYAAFDDDDALLEDEFVDADCDYDYDVDMPRRRRTRRQRAARGRRKPRRKQAQTLDDADAYINVPSKATQIVTKSPQRHRHGPTPIKKSSVDFRFELDESEIRIGREIGRGHYGVVMKGLWQGATPVAVKFLHTFNGRHDTRGHDPFEVNEPTISAEQQRRRERLRKKERNAILTAFRREVSILMSLRHPNIVLYLGAVTRPPKLMLVTEYFGRGSLYDLLHPASPRDYISLEYGDRLRFARDAACGVNYLHLHSPPILHRDLKSKNMLVTDDFKIKVADFGLARVKERGVDEHDSTSKSSSSTCIRHTGATRKGVKEGEPRRKRVSLLDVTIQAPEVLRSNRQYYSEKSDTYSFALFMWELNFRKLPFTGLKPATVADRVKNYGLRPSSGGQINPQYAKLMEKCWSENPKSRPSFQRIIYFFNHFLNEM